jgi:hypothetical protein
MTLIEALEKLAVISKKGLDTLIQIQDSANEPITIGEAIKAIRDHDIDIYEKEDYSIGSDGIRKVKDNDDLGDIVYRVIKDA